MVKYCIIGIKGSGCASLAKILKKEQEIIGVDYQTYFYTEEGLEDIKIFTFEDFKLKREYIYIIGNAFKKHPLVKEIIKDNYQYFYYPNFIEEYFKDHIFISISGSHGKTTTTKLVATLLDDCSALIGDGSAFSKGKKYFILESCEYRDTFLNYYPDIALILNIDYDHPDYFKDKETYFNSFNKFSLNSKRVIVNGDDLGKRNLANKNLLKYGQSQENDVVFKYFREKGKSYVKLNDKVFLMPFNGEHFAYDFLGAYLICKELGLDDKVIIERLKNFQLPRRRMEKIQKNGVMTILDYAHHPNEIKCVFNSLKEMYPLKEKVLIFQPHTYSRTLALKEEFKEVFKLFDKVYLLPIFTSVREKKDLNLEKYLENYFQEEVLDFDNLLKLDSEKIYVFLGAGDIDNYFSKY